MKYYLSLVLIFLNTISYAQLSVSFPLERNIFQRNQQNTATFPIYGTVTVNCQEVQVRLQPLDGKTANATDWKTLDTSLKANAFTGKITAAGGWYRVEVRALEGGKEVAQSAIQRVGIGEVFFTAGQSNMQGVGWGDLLPADGAKDDRVNSTTFKINDANPEEVFPPMVGQKIEQFTSTGIRGTSHAWMYGELGDQLVAKLGVPVMFINCSFHSTDIDTWYKSSVGEMSNLMIALGIRSGYPYGFLKSALRNYANIYGARAILWHQGESDIDTDENTYFTKLRNIILSTRQDAAFELPWVVARVSYGNSRYNQRIINAQNRTTTEISNVFKGPLSDTIQVPRPDNFHFYKVNEQANGVRDLGRAWNNSLTPAFFEAAGPKLPEAAHPELSYSCNASLEKTIKVDKPFAGIFWSNNATSETTTLREGEIQALIRDSKGFYYRSNKLIVSQVANPVISSDKGKAFCSGDTVTLSVAAQTGLKVKWNNGIQESSQKVKNPGTYSVFYTDAENCISPTASLTLAENARPDAPVLSAPAGLVSCAGQELIAKIDNPNGSIRWSNGSTENQLTFKTPGIYTLTARQTSAEGCVSELSKSLKLSIGEKPELPRITAPNGLKVCDYDTLRLAVDSKDVINWSTGQKGNLIKLTNQKISAAWAVVTNVKGCHSDTARISGLQFYESPDKPTIEAPGGLAACASEQIVLEVANKDRQTIEWSTGETKSAIQVNSPSEANYTAQYVNEYGCKSARSAAVKPRFLELPKSPVISQDGPLALQIVAPLPGTTYQWFDNAGKLLGSDLILVPQSGATIYSVAAKTYTIGVDNAKKCFSAKSNMLNFNKLAADKSFIVYPNPVQGDGKVWIVNDKTEQVAVFLADLTGQIHYTTSLKVMPTPTLIQLPARLKGLFVLQLKGVSVYKAVKLQFL